MTETNLETSAGHWHDIRAQLCDRIRSRWKAIERLSPDGVDWDTIEQALNSAENPEQLLRLHDQVDRRLDAAFAPRSLRSRAAPADANPPNPDPRAFK